MPQYVDGFVIPVPKKNLAAYRRLARVGKKVWLDHGALAYAEAVGDDLRLPFGVNFDKLVKCKPDETVVFAWIVYRSRKHRDAVNKKVMADPRLQRAMGKGPPAFDLARMTSGGFTVIVQGEPMHGAGSITPAVGSGRG